jgi:hypothetical protein
MIIDNTQLYFIELHTGDQLLSGGILTGDYSSHRFENNQLKVTNTYQGQNYERVFNLP